MRRRFQDRTCASDQIVTCRLFISLISDVNQLNSTGTPRLSKCEVKISLLQLAAFQISSVQVKCSTLRHSAHILNNSQMFISVSEINPQNVFGAFHLVVTKSGNGERGTGVWERVYSGFPHNNSKWRTQEKKNTDDKCSSICW